VKYGIGSLCRGINGNDFHMGHMEYWMFVISLGYLVLDGSSVCLLGSAFLGTRRM
jgi:hypothetical protein